MTAMQPSAITVSRLATPIGWALGELGGVICVVNISQASRQTRWMRSRTALDHCLIRRLDHRICPVSSVMQMPSPIVSRMRPDCWEAKARSSARKSPDSEITALTLPPRSNFRTFNCVKRTS